MYEWTFVIIAFFLCVSMKYEHVAYWAGRLDVCNHLFWGNYKLLKALIFLFHKSLFSILIFICTDKIRLAEAETMKSIWNLTCNSATAYE